MESMKPKAWMALAMFAATVVPGLTTVTALQAGDRIVGLLEGGQPVFGVFAGEPTPEQGARMARSPEVDFVFYSMERGPFDIPRMKAYMEGMATAASEEGVEPHAFALRIPPIRDGQGAARERVQQALRAGVDAVVFPHVETPEHAAAAVGLMGERLWPANPDGDLVAMLIVEDRVGVERAREIVATGGVSVVFAGPGDLSRAYGGDAGAVEAAIQTILATCLEFDVPCGITAGPDDIGERLEQGFRVFIVTDPEAVAAGRHAWRELRQAEQERHVQERLREPEGRQRTAKQ